MKTKITSYCAMLLLAATCCLNAAETAPTKPASAEFEKMKTLVGTWKGTAEMGEGPVELTIEYRLIAAGSVLEERVMQGTPNEMVTMYYDQDGKLALTHYCMLGNRPAMKLGKSDGKTLAFDFDGEACCIDPKKDTHMHALTLRFEDADTITSSCKSLMDGKPMEGKATTLKRVKTKSVAAK